MVEHLVQWDRMVEINKKSKINENDLSLYEFADGDNEVWKSVSMKKR